MFTILLADLFNLGVRPDPHEAIAITQQLIHNGAASPSPDNVQLARDGTVTCVGCAVTPAVFEMAILLNSLVPPGTPGSPGGLRYAIARGLLEVEAPPFDSIHDFSRALRRFEIGDRRAVISAMLRRMPQAAAPPAARVLVADSASTVLVADSAATVLAADSAPTALVAATAPTVRVANTAPASRARPARSGWRDAVAAAAALVIAAAGGFAMGHVIEWRSARHQAIATVARAAAAVPRPLDRAPSKGTTAATSAIATGPFMPAAPVPRSRRESSSGREGARRDAAMRQSSDMDGHIVAAFDRDHRPVFSPAFASNGSAMFFHTGGPRGEPSALAMTSAASDHELEVMTIVDDGARNYHVQPSPDGRMIAFDSDRDGDRGVYVARRDGRDVRRISGPGYAAVPTWSPDGRRIAYIRGEPGNPKVWNLWLQSLDTDRVTRLTGYGYGQTWSASWFPDNRRVAYSHEDRLVILDLETGQSNVYGSPVKGHLVRTPAVSPDGRKVIFQVFGRGAWMLDLEDGSLRCVLTDPTAEEFAWSPDGRRVAFHSRRDGQWGIYVTAD